MAELEPIDDHFHQALVKFVAPFWGKPRMAALLQSFINRVQELEDAAWEVLNAFNVNTCDATRLAVLGRIVGQPNFGWSTETYRCVVRAKIRANRSLSLEDDLVDVLRLALDSEERVRVSSLAPATVYVLSEDSVDAEQIEALQYIMPHARAGGVKMHLFWKEDGYVVGDLWGEGTWGTTEGCSEVIL